jgi:hypothetical protein
MADDRRGRLATSGHDFSIGPEIEGRPFELSAAEQQPSVSPAIPPDARLRRAAITQAALQAGLERGEAEALLLGRD